MPLRLTNLELPVQEPEEMLGEAIARRISLPAVELLEWRILRKSLDARSREALRFVYTVVVTWPGEAAGMQPAFGHFTQGHVQSPVGPKAPA